MRGWILTILLFVGLSVSAEISVSKVSHIEAVFRQVKQQAMLTEPQILTGKFVYDAPSKVSWKYDKGIEARLPEQMLNFIAAAVSGQYLETNSDFSVTEQDGVIVLIPLKRQLKKMFSSIKLHLKDNIAQEVILNEATGDITTISLSNVVSR